jgi:hypothetical protein
MLVPHSTFPDIILVLGNLVRDWVDKAPLLIFSCENIGEISFSVMFGYGYYLKAFCLARLSFS